MKKHPYYGFEPEVGDPVEARTITKVLRYSLSGQVWYVVCDDDKEYAIEDTVYDPGPVKWRFA